MISVHCPCIWEGIYDRNQKQSWFGSTPLCLFGSYGNHPHSTHWAIVGHEFKRIICIQAWCIPQLDASSHHPNGKQCGMENHGIDCPECQSLFPSISVTTTIFWGSMLSYDTPLWHNVSFQSSLSHTYFCVDPIQRRSIQQDNCQKMIICLVHLCQLGCIKNSCGLTD